MQTSLVVEYLAHGDTARWQAVSHVGSHGLPAAPIDHITEDAAARVAADLARVGLRSRVVRVWPDGGREEVPVTRPLERTRPAPLETKS